MCWALNLKLYLCPLLCYFLCSGSLQQDFQAVEAELDKLQNVCEEEELEREKDSHLAQLAAYKKSKMAEAYTVKGSHLLIHCMTLNSFKAVLNWKRTRAFSRAQQAPLFLN